MTDRLEEALDGMSTREVERLMGLAERRLQRCAIDGEDGAYAVHISWKAGNTGKTSAILLCPACIERHRVPESRAKKDDG